MFTSQEKKNLTKLLACAVNQDEVLSLDGLHGFLFGLAIIPEPVTPSEWLPGIFGEEMLEVDDEKEGERLLGSLFSAYIRITQQNEDKKLTFPFEVSTTESKDIQRIQDWTHGLFLAISLRPEVWRMNDEVEADGYEPDEEALEMASCISVIMGIVFPEDIPELFQQKKTKGTLLGKRPVEIEAKLFAMLPGAVLLIQEHANAARDGLRELKSSRPSVLLEPLRVKRLVETTRVLVGAVQSTRNAAANEFVVSGLVTDGAARVTIQGVYNGCKILVR
jgi:uncharacterized protein